MKENYEIHGDHITLGQLLKELTVISSGGMAKFYLQENPVSLNGVLENRRGKKLFPGDEVTISDIGTYLMIKVGA